MAFEIHQVEQPSWLGALIERVSEAMVPLGLMGKVGYRWLFPNSPLNASNEWIVWVYPPPNEAYGGQYDGSRLVVGFELNVDAIVSVFSGIESVCWRAPINYNGNLDGPEIEIRGRFMDRVVCLRVFSLPPADEDPALQINTVTGQFWSAGKSVG